MHASVVLAQDIREYAPLFSEIADAYYDQRMYTAAVAIYEELGQDSSVSHFCPPPGFAHPLPEQTSSIYVLERAAACRRMNGDLENSAAIYEQGFVFIRTLPTHAC
jgi:general transcription factor 3C polypeptide 3 (transcription factor C subunit 4)